MLTARHYSCLHRSRSYFRLQSQHHGQQRTAAYDVVHIHFPGCIWILDVLPAASKLGEGNLAVWPPRHCVGNLGWNIVGNSISAVLGIGGVL